MSRIKPILFLFLFVAIAGIVCPVFAVQLQSVVTGLSSPVYVTSAKDRTNRLFIVERGGNAGDFVGIPPTTLSIPIGDTSATATVQVNGDVTVEGDETFLLKLSNPKNATLADTQGQGTILNDD